MPDDSSGKWPPRLIPSFLSSVVMQTQCFAALVQGLPAGAVLSDSQQLHIMGGGDDAPPPIIITDDLADI
jgi:hypothetical protein